MNAVGIVIVNYNDIENTLNLINNLKDYKIINKIVVVDDNSTDNSLSVLKKLNIKKLHIIESIRNSGYAHSLNMGAKYLMDEYKNPYIILSNNDIEVPNEETIKNLIKHFKDENIKIVMPKIKEGEEYKYGWKLTSPFIDLLINIPLFNRRYRSKYLDYPSDYFKTDIAIVDCIYGCFFIVEGNFLKSINYFDSKTFLYYEENILGRKAQEKGVLSIVDNNNYCIHHHNKTIGNNVSNLNKYKIYKSSQLYYEKKYNKANLIIMFFFRLFYLINLIPYKIKSIKK